MSAGGASSTRGARAQEGRGARTSRGGEQVEEGEEGFPDARAQEEAARALRVNSATITTHYIAETADDESG